MMSLINFQILKANFLEQFRKKIGLRPMSPAHVWNHVNNFYIADAVRQMLEHDSYKQVSKLDEQTASTMLKDRQKRTMTVATRSQATATMMINLMLSCVRFTPSADKLIVEQWLMTLDWFRVFMETNTSNMCDMMLNPYGRQLMNDGPSHKDEQASITKQERLKVVMFILQD